LGSGKTASLGVTAARNPFFLKSFAPPNPAPDETDAASTCASLADQKIVDRAVACWVPDNLFIAAFSREYSRASGTAALAKRASKLVPAPAFIFSCLRPPFGFGLERFDAAIIISHVRAVHRAQHTPMPCAIAQAASSRFRAEHHLDALACIGGSFHRKRLFSRRNLGFAAFDHLLPRIR